MNTGRRQSTDSGEDDADCTVARVVPIPASARLPTAMGATRRMPHVDARLLAIVRGEIDPEREVLLDDPFGGLIPVDDEGEPLSSIELMFDEERRSDP